MSSPISFPISPDVPSNAPPLQRRRFSDFSGLSTDRYERRMLSLLLDQDGSTTRLCESIAAGPIDLIVMRQKFTADVPEVVHRHLPGERFIERMTCLAAHGEAMMDNLSYIALSGLEPSVEADLRAGKMPIGHMLARLWIRRRSLDVSHELAQRLWAESGAPDPGATRTYCIDTPQSPLMLITETYRRGMLAGLDHEFSRER